MNRITGKQRHLWRKGYSIFLMQNPNPNPNPNPESLFKCQRDNNKGRMLNDTNIKELLKGRLLKCKLSLRQKKGFVK